MSTKARTIAKYDTTQKAFNAMELRKAGVPWAEIADRLGYKDAGSAYNLVKRVVDTVPVESAKELRVAGYERQSALLAAVWEQATDPTHPRQMQAVDRARALINDMGALFGLGDDRSDAGPVADGMLTIGIDEEDLAVLSELRTKRLQMERTTTVVETVSMAEQVEVS